MTLLDYLHEQYETGDGRPVIFECTECGHRDQSLGSLHAHIEGHRGYTRLGIQVPLTDTSPGDFEALMKLTEIVAIEETEAVDLQEVEGL